MANTEERRTRDKSVRTVKSKKASQEFIEIALSDTGIASFNISDQSAITITFTLLSDFGLQMFGIGEADFYLNSVDSDNSIPDGANISPGDWRTDRWFSWGETDNKNIKFKSFIYNESGSQQSVLFRGQFRYLVEEGDVS